MTKRGSVSQIVIESPNDSEVILNYPRLVTFLTLGMRGCSMSFICVRMRHFITIFFSCFKTKKDTTGVIR